MIKHLTYSFFSVCTLLLLQLGAKAQINAQFVGRYSIGNYTAAGGAAEITAYDPASKRMFVINGPDTSLRIVNISNPAIPVQISSISIKPYGIDLTSVACKNGLVAVAVIDSNGKTNPSSIVFMDINGNFISKVKAGANADNVVFTNDGKKLLVANEGEPNVGYTIDPEGSISIIDLSGGAASLTQANVNTAGFSAYNSPSIIDPKIRIYGRIQTSGGTFLRNSTVAEDLEPEYIAISDDNTTAWVTCQENNAIAIVDINTATVTSLIPLGFKNHYLTGNGLDPSDQPASAGIANWPVFGMYQPDVVSSYRVGGQTYLVTANEGDARADWGAANNEEVRMGNASYVLDTVKFGGAPNVAALKANSALGRLNVTNRYGDFNNDGKFDSIFTYGSRSFSIWNATTGALVWDSKDEFERITLARYPNNFNAGHTTNSSDDRSDNKGPEPETVVVGKILDSTYAFIGLERIGGIMIYNITNPNNPYFVQYINTRNFSVTPSQANLATVGDLGPEGLVFIPRNESPNGKDLVLLSNEVSGTVAIFQVNSRSNYQMQILHSGDMESGLAAVLDAPNYAAITDKLEDEHVNTLILSSGDNTLPGPFLSSGEDPSLQTPLRNTSARYYSGTQSLRPAIGRADIAIMNIIGFNASALGNHEFDLGTTDLNGQIGVDIRNNGADKRWIGAQFPYVSCNLNFSNDVNLNYLYTNQILRDTAFKTPLNITNNNQKRGIAPSIIIERNGEKIGIVGATTQILAKISSPGFTTIIGPQVDDMPALAAIIQPVVDSLIAKEGVNKIILLAHLQQIANEKALAPLLRNVDIIISGGNHAISADGNDRLIQGNVATESYPIRTVSLTGQPMVILNNSSEWKYVGRFVCDFDSAGVLLPNLLDSTLNGVYASDSLTVTKLWGSYSAAFATGTKGADVRTICNAVNNVIVAKDGNIIGKSTVFLEGRRNFVRTEETNLGNLSSDANLWYAKQIDPQVRVSLKNGGGIRSAVGFVNAVGANVVLESTQANPSAGKLAGDISQLDVENSLRFNNGLVIVTINASGLRRLIEHSVAATTPNATPGQFPQVGGIAFSYDTTRPANNRIVSMVITDSLGNRQDTIVRNGMLFGDTSRTFKIVTLNFLANPTTPGSLFGGDNYPFPQVKIAQVNLDTAILSNGTSLFAGKGSEQDAFAEYMLARHNTTGSAFSVRDTTLQGDKRIQLLNARPDSVLYERPLLTLAQVRATTQPNIVRTRGIVTRAWGRFIYIQDATGAIGVRQGSGAMVDSITSSGLKEGDSLEVVGTRNDFNNYAQIQLTNGAYSESNRVTKLASNVKLPTPIVVTLKQINTNGEQYESKLIRVVNLKTASTGNFAASTNYTIWDGSTPGDTMLLRVIAATDTEMDDAPLTSIPVGQFTFEGTLIQFCSSPTNGCTLGYQLQGLRKKEIIPQFTPFNLVIPVSNTKITTSAASTASVTFNWNKSLNATAHKWFITVATGNYTTPWASGISSMDTTFTYSYSQFDALAAAKGVAKGDSVLLKWTAYAYLGKDSIIASQSNNIWVVREPAAIVLGAFNLVSPTNNAKVEVEQNSTVAININWNTSSNAAKYMWFATTPTGSFAAPLLRVPSNNSGNDNMLTLTSGAVDAILASLTVKKGDSAQLKWTVYAYKLNGDSLKASQEFNINLVRKRKLQAFGLTSPADNARLEVEQNETTPVVINWSASATGATYKWLLDEMSGTFVNPWASLNADNAGLDNKLTLTAGAIDDLLASKSVADGDSISLKWTVRAYEVDDSLQASQIFNVLVLRKKTVGLSEVNVNRFMKLYPNPTNGNSTLSFILQTAEQLSISVTDIQGKSLMNKMKINGVSGMNEFELPTAGVQDGMYFVTLTSNGKSDKIKLVVIH